jgi:hypothetical protein
MGAYIPRAPVTSKGNTMKIIEVIVYYEIDCCKDCDGPGYYTYGYYTPDYDIRKVVLSILNKNQDWDLQQIQVYEITLNVPEKDTSKNITERYIGYDENTYEYQLCD